MSDKAQTYYFVDVESTANPPTQNTTKAPCIRGLLEKIVIFS